MSRYERYSEKTKCLYFTKKDEKHFFEKHIFQNIRKTSFEKT